jgi:hypothetical protein
MQIRFFLAVALLVVRGNIYIITPRRVARSKPLTELYEDGARFC